MSRLTDQLREATRAQSRMRPVEAAPEEPPPSATSRPRSALRWLPVLVILVLVLGGWLLIQQFRADARMQDCVMSGRKNCAPVDTH